MESPEGMTLTFYISSAICAQADFDFLTCSGFSSLYQQENFPEMMSAQCTETLSITPVEH